MSLLELESDLRGLTTRQLGAYAMRLVEECSRSGRWILLGQRLRVVAAEHRLAEIRDQTRAAG